MGSSILNADFSSLGELVTLRSSDIAGLPLWQHQREAIFIVSKYVRRYAGTHTGSIPASLVNIPTGGGKSAIIATVAHGSVSAKKVLVLTPRISLRRQLFKDLSGVRGPLVSLGAAKSRLRKVVEVTNASMLQGALRDADIVVATIQLIQAIRRSNEVTLNAIAMQLDCVMVDEGHYEPAPSWSDAIRSLQVPTILFTATPYRNDLRAFSLEPGATYVAQYRQLRDLKILRALDISVRPKVEAVSAAKFVVSVLNAFKDKYGAVPSADRRLIIRCKSKAEINNVQKALAAHGGGVSSIGIHERFSAPAKVYDPNQREYSQPPDPEICKHPIWVHQYKLLEGIDGPCFRAVSIYGALGSARSLVQQIGRVLRNPQRVDDESALLIEHSEGSVKRRWDRYIEFDSGLTTETIALGIQEVATAFDTKQPATMYIENEFRSRYVIGSAAGLEHLQSLRMPLRCSIIRASKPAALGRLLQLVEARLHLADSPWRVLHSDTSGFVVLFISIGTSPFLAEHYFVEKTLNLYAARLSGDMIAVLDTSRVGVSAEVQRHVGPPISRKELSRVLSADGKATFTEIRARSTALGQSSVRGRVVQAASLEITPPLLDDFQFAPSSLTAIDLGTGALRGHSIRSLGFGHGRISDVEALQEYAHWTSWVDQLMAKAQSSRRLEPTYFQRFAQPLSAPPPAPEARSILFDAASIREKFLFQPTAVSSPAEAIEIDDACLDLTAQPADPTIRLFGPGAVINGSVIDGYVKFDPVTERYIVQSKLLKNVRMNDGSGIDLVDYLNSTQSFSIVPEEVGVIYSQGTYFDPKLPLGGRFDERAIGFEVYLRRIPR
ncbi:DEAD/DEAH box helicase [Lysobacter gummosus]|uniref:DEAD/DEAH box helicase n=2 Tax=Lysobacter gummosus TaxID=262324 RepID=UPI00362B75F0